jgi:hypothetical protein
MSKLLWLKAVRRKGSAEVKNTMQSAQTNDKTSSGRMQMQILSTKN